jgi:hypothetical protein
VVQEIAANILEIGQQTPIHVRPDGDRFVLVEGLHRLEACKALGERAIIGLLVPAEVAHQHTLSPPSAEADAERQKMERLKKLRLEREAAEELATASGAVLRTEAARQREHPGKTARNKATSSQSGRGPSGSSPKTLSDWIKQERDGGRY